MMNSETVFVLRVVKPDMTSRGPDKYKPDLNRFKYPESGPVSCLDFEDSDACGRGLHGWLWGAGDLESCGYWGDSDAKWLVIEVNVKDLRHGSGELIGKCKFSKGDVVFCGSRDDAVKFITERAPAGTPILFGTATAGNYGTATAGDRGTATAGNYGTATAGDRGTATAGNYGTATAGDRGTATAGDRGTATAGECGTATAGYGGTATAGNYGTATAGDRGTATAGYGGTATAGECGCIVLLYWDSKRARYKRVIGEIGENDLVANTPYILDADGKIVEKK